MSMRTSSIVAHRGNAGRKGGNNDGLKSRNAGWIGRPGMWSPSLPRLPACLWRVVRLSARPIPTSRDRGAGAARGRHETPFLPMGPCGDRMADIARLAELIEPEAAALGLDLVLVKMIPSEAGDGGEALQIMAEDPATGQLVIDQCAALSRRVSDMMDAREEAGEVLIEGAYHLEVSSPGIDRPLTRAQDFA